MIAGYLRLVAGTAASLAVLLLAFGPLERAWAARPRERLLRPGWATDLAFLLGQYLLWNVLILTALEAVRDLLAAHGPSGLQAAFARQPLALQALEAVALSDLAVYAFHRAQHRWDWLWRFHAVHHSAEHLDWLAAHREHPVDGLLTQLVINLPPFLLGLPLEALSGFVVFRGLWAILIHANVRLPLGPLGVLLGAPETHRWHHLRAERTLHNFANLSPLVDVLFGTYHRPAHEDYPLGLPGPYPRGYWAQLLHPLRPSPGASTPAAAPDSPASAAPAPAGGGGATGGGAWARRR